MEFLFFILPVAVVFGQYLVSPKSERCEGCEA
jgi:hypothetical protein